MKGGDNMKKKMTVLCALLALVGISSYAVSGTYAKYVADYDLADSARVAKWGFNDETFTVDLFKDSYKNGTVTDVESDRTASDKVVAPGTSGFYAFTLGQNKPETNYEITIKDNASEDQIATTGNGQVKYYLKKVTGMSQSALDSATFDTFDFATTGNKYNTIQDLVKGIGTEFNGIYAANTAPHDVYVIGWEWTFEDAADSDRDVNDTNLGNATTLATVSLNITLAVEQSEKAPTK